MDTRRREVLELLKKESGVLFCKLRNPGRSLKVINRDEGEEIDIYSWLPGPEEGGLLESRSLRKGEGDRINVARRGSPLAGFFLSHSEEISYEVAVKDASLLENESVETLASTSTGDIVAFGYEIGGGKIFLLPSELPAQQSAGAELLKATGKLLRNGLTPGPAWLEEYQLSDEADVQSEISDLDSEIEKLQSAREEKRKELNSLSAFKELLSVRTEFGLKKSLQRVLNRLDLDTERGRSGIDLRVNSPDGSEFAVKVGVEAEGPVGVRPYHELVRGINDLKIYDNDDPQGVLLVNGYADKDPKERSNQVESELEEGCNLYGFSLVKTDEIHKEMKGSKSRAERAEKLVDLFRGS